MPNNYGFLDCDTPPVRGSFFRIPIDRTAVIRLKIKRIRKPVPGDTGTGIRELAADIASKKGGKRMGCFHGYIFTIAALAHGSLCGSDDKKTKELYDFARDLTGHARKGIADSYNNGELLYLSRIEILSPYRGNFYGIKATKAIVHYCRRAFKVTACFMEPFPLQYEKTPHQRATARQNSKVFRKDKSKLVNYYQKYLPIKQLSPSSKYYRLPLDRIK